MEGRRGRWEEGWGGAVGLCTAPPGGGVGDVRLLAARGEEEATARAREAADQHGNGPWGENPGGTTK